MYSKWKTAIPIKREPGSLNIVIFTVLLIDLYRYQQKSMPIHFTLNALFLCYQRLALCIFVLFLFIFTCNNVILGGCRSKGTHPTYTLETSALCNAKIHAQ